MATLVEQIEARVERQERYEQEIPAGRVVDRAMAVGRLGALRECRDVVAAAPQTIGGMVEAMYADLNAQPYSDAAVKRLEERIVAELMSSVPPSLLFRAMLSNLETSAREWMGDQGAACAYVVIRDGGPTHLLPGELLPGDLLISIVHPVKDLHRAANRIGYTIERIQIGYTEGFQVHRNNQPFGTETYKIETASEELCTIGRMALAEKLTDGQ